MTAVFKKLVKLKGAKVDRKQMSQEDHSVPEDKGKSIKILHRQILLTTQDIPIGFSIPKKNQMKQ